MPSSPPRELAGRMWRPCLPGNGNPASGGAGASVPPAPPYRYQETAVTLSCGGNQFLPKGRPSPIRLESLSAGKGRPCKESVLPDGLTEGMTLPVTAVTIKEGKTTAPKALHRGHAALRDGNGWRKGYAGGCGAQGHRHTGHPRRYLEKLVSTGFVERKKQKEATNLIPRRLAFP